MDIPLPGNHPKLKEEVEGMMDESLETTEQVPLLQRPARRDGKGPCQQSDPITVFDSAATSDHTPTNDPLDPMHNVPEPWETSFLNGSTTQSDPILANNPLHSFSISAEASKSNFPNKKTGQHIQDAVINTNATEDAALDQPNSDSRGKYDIQDLHKRDLESINYSRQLLEEGDTLVYISYPGDITFCDKKGSMQPYKTYRVSSNKLKSTGSPKFSKLLEDWPQHRARKRKGFLGTSLPDGIKYILDLTPLEEGDEAVEIVSELSCSEGIRNWYRSERVCSVDRRLVGGYDDVPRPANVPPEAAARYGLKSIMDYMDPCQSAPVTLTANPQPCLFHEPDVSPGCMGCAPGEAAERKDVTDYCPIRHRVGIENLLLIIQGMEPTLDSAPKIWTLCVLAKYYECASAVIDHVTAWLLAENNSKFIEVLPEAAINIGLCLNMPIVTRASFAVLVSKEAFGIACRSSQKAFDDGEADQFPIVRTPEDIDEDLINTIQHASQEFHDRIQQLLTDLLDERMTWFLELPEYRKICKFEDYSHKNKTDEKVHEKRTYFIQKLLVNLRGYVRGRIGTCLNEPLNRRKYMDLDSRRRELLIRTSKSSKDSEGDPSFHTVYDGLETHQRVLLGFFWTALSSLEWNEDCSGQVFYSDPSFMKSAVPCSGEHHGGDTPFVVLADLHESRNMFNHEVWLEYGKEPKKPVRPPKHMASSSIDIMEEEKPNYAFMSAYNPDHAYLQRRLASYKQMAKELDDDSFLSVQSDSSTTGLLNIPIRPKEQSKFSISLKDRMKFWQDHRVTDQNVETPTTEIGSASDQPINPINPPITGNPWEELRTSDYFDLAQFLLQVNQYITNLCTKILTNADDAEFVLTYTLLCIDDDEFKYLPLWAGGNDDGSGGVTASAVPPTYYASVEGLTPGVRYKGANGFVGVGGDGPASVDTSLRVGMGSEEDTLASTGASDTGSIFSMESYDVLTPVDSRSVSGEESEGWNEESGNASESDFEIVGAGDEDDGVDTDTEMDGEEVGDHGAVENLDDGDDNMDWMDGEEEAEWDDNVFTE